MSKDNKGKFILAGLIAGAGASYAAASHKMFVTSCVRDAEWSRGNKPRVSQFAKYGSRVDADRAWFDEQAMEEVIIQSSIDDVKLFGRYLACESPKRLVLCAHGYRSTAEKNFAGMARWLHEHDCDVLLIDQRACGHSEGNYITFGAREKYDVLDWLDWLDARDSEQLPIYLYGVSMGAATVCCTSQYAMPKPVVGMIADCGYASMKDIIAKTLKEDFRIPPYPFMWSFDRECANTAHFSMKEADVEAALRKCHIPALFIHGTEDDFVPPSHAIRNYHACASQKKDILWVDGAGHSVSFYEDTLKYTTAVTDLFRLCEQGEEK